MNQENEIFEDNFAGGGGASTGAEEALGRPVDHAVNHDQHALGMHRTNHPQTIHHCEDVFDVDPVLLAGGRPIGGAWFSPDCKHFSKAKGGKPVNKRIRGLAFVIFRHAKQHARVIYMENVEEIQTWGPLLPNGKPDPAHKGRTWRSFLEALSAGLEPDNADIPHIMRMLNFTRNKHGRLVEVPAQMQISREDLERGFGYEVETRELRACDYGAPTIRKRLFMIARCDGRPIVWPEPTHFAPADPRPGPRWRTIAECIDWSIPCHSIFLTRKQARKVNCRRPLARSTMRRTATGIDRFVLKAAKPFMISLTHQGGDRVEDIDAPANTITGAHRGEKALVSASISRFNGDHAGRQDGAARNKSLEEPLTVQDTSNRFGLVSAHMARDFGQSIGQPADAPAPTVMPDGQGKTKVIEASLAPIISEHANASNNRSMPADEPMRTQCAQVKGGHFSLVSAHMIQKGHSSSNSQMVKGADEPMRCQTAHAEHAIVTGTLVGAGGPARAGEPRPVDGPGGTIVAKNTTALAAAHLVKMRGTSDSHIASAAQDPRKPVDTLSAGGQHHAVSTAFLAQANDGFNKTPGHEATTPASTISATGSQQQLVTANTVAYYGSETDGQAMDESMRTASTKPRFGLIESEVVAPGLTPEQIAGARRVAAFLRRYGVKFEGEFASITVDGTQFVIVDIGMRMLTPRELYRAQGFPERYIIDHAILVDPKTGAVKKVRLTKEQQIRMCGNSVCPPVATALIRANSSDMIIANRRQFQTEMVIENHVH